MKDVKIIIATHKKYKMPTDNMYIPLQVGSEKKEDIGFKKDNVGDNISNKNPNYCELTGLYWAWKNLKNDYIGIAHYRRHFTVHKIIPSSENKKFNVILTCEQASKILKDTDVILPKKRKYYIENLYSHYKHTMYIEPLNITREIIEEKYPEYLTEFNNLKKRTSAHMFNMFIMKKDYLNQYCTWLFNILGELEKKVDIKEYDKFHARFYGRISELLLDVWINKNHINYKEIKVIDMQNINWIKKVFSFLISKFTGKKYNKSF